MFQRLSSILKGARADRDAMVFTRSHVRDLQQWALERMNAGDTVQRPCPLCGQSDGAPAMKAPVYEFRHCGGCGLVYATPILNEKAIDDFYIANSKYMAIWDREYEAIRRNPDQPAYQGIIQLLLAHRQGDGKCLDVGCGHGKLLQQMKPHFATAEGVELNRETARRCEELFGVKVHQDRLERLGLPEASFDVVTLNQVIEHLNDLGLVSEIVRILKPGGILYVGCPNMGSFSMRLFGGRHIHVSTHVHSNMFDRASMARLAERHGLEVVRNESDANADIGAFDVFFYYLWRRGFSHRANYSFPLWALTRAARKLLRRRGGEWMARRDGGSYLLVLLRKPPGPLSPCSQGNGPRISDQG